MANVRQFSFSSGEISPALYGRIDLVKYATGLKTCKNFMVMRHGGIANRAGTSFVAEVGDSTKAVRLIPFKFNNDQTYVLEFGDLYVRVHRNGALLTETAQNITAATQANPCVLTITGHLYSNGDEVAIADVGGMTELNNRNLKVANVTANTFSLQYMDGSAVDSTAFAAYTSGGTASKVYEVTTTYVEDDLSTLQHIQSADIVTITHPNYAPRELARTGHTAWTLAEIAFGASVDAPTNLTSSSSGATEYYVVTAVDTSSGEESLQSVKVGSTNKTSTISWEGVQNAAQYNIYRSLGGTYGWIGVAAPDTSSFSAHSIASITRSGSTVTVTTVSASTFATNDIIEIINASQEAYNGLKKITVTDSTHFTYTISGSPTTPATGAGTMFATETSLSFKDETYSPDTLDTPPIEKRYFTDTGDYPSVCAYYQQRLIFANTDNDPEGVWASKSALSKNHWTSTPSQDDDAIRFSLAGREVNEIAHLLDVGKLLMFTTSGEWVINGDTAGILLPTAINPAQDSANGSGILPPLVVNGTALYVQARGSVIRDLGYDLTADGYTGDELTIFSSHLFDNYTLVDWAYQQIPHSIVWIVRSDGMLLGLTYVREHQVFGWHRHEFEGGTAENVCVVPEGNEDILYVVVKRTINGTDVRYVERMNTRKIVDIKDMVMMDSALSYDGRHTGSITMTLSGGTTWAYDETITLTASTATFASTDVGKQIHLTGSDGTLIRFTIEGYTSTTVVTGKPHKTVPATMQSTAVATWAEAVASVSGLWHLEGESVSVLADGFVSANPNNDAYETRTVTNGAIALDDPHAVIHVGLPVTADIETLNIDTPQGTSLADKKKHVNQLTAHVESSRGLFAGPDADNLTELKQRNVEDYDSPIALKTGIVDLNITGEWGESGRVLMRQVDPLPLTILSVIPSGFIAG